MARKGWCLGGNFWRLCLCGLLWHRILLKTGGSLLWWRSSLNLWKVCLCLYRYLIANTHPIIDMIKDIIKFSRNRYFRLRLGKNWLYVRPSIPRNVHNHSIFRPSGRLVFGKRHPVSCASTEDFQLWSFPCPNGVYARSCFLVVSCGNNYMSNSSCRIGRLCMVRFQVKFKKSLYRYVIRVILA